MKQYIVLTLCVLMSLFVLTSADGQDKPVPKQMKPALLVIDIQNDYLNWVPEAEKAMGLETINGAIWLFHQNGFPVIRVYHYSPEWGPKPDTEGFEYPASIMINEDDPKIIKSYPSAFKKTELDKILKEKGCNSLFLCGLSAVGCVLATYYGAMDNDYNVVMVKDGIMSHNSRYTDAVEEIFDTMSYATLKFIIESTPR